MTTHLSADARAALTTAQLTENTLTLTEQLPLKTYAQVKTALGRIGGGGKWMPRRQTHEFPSPFQDELEILIETGIVGNPLKSLDQLNSFYATPAPIAERMAGYLSTCSPYEIIVEPSAGNGALADAMRKVAPRVHVQCIEPDGTRAATLRDKGHQVFTGTFGDWAAANAFADAVDGFIMNPPFAVPGDPFAWLAHLELAWMLLRPGGLLIAIAPASLDFRKGHRFDTLRDLFLEDVGGGWQTLPSGTFHAAGTDVETVLITTTKPVLQ